MGMKDVHQDKPSPELIKMISYGHDKENQMTVEVFNESYSTGIEPLIKTLSTLTEATLSHVLNTIVRQTKVMKAELDAQKKKK